MTRKFGPSRKASTGHTSTQSVYLQRMHASVTTKVMGGPATAQPQQAPPEQHESAPTGAALAPTRVICTTPDRGARFQHSPLELPEGPVFELEAQRLGVMVVDQLQRSPRPAGHRTRPKTRACRSRGAIVRRSIGGGRWWWRERTCSVMPFRGLERGGTAAGARMLMAGTAPAVAASAVLAVEAGRRQPGRVDDEIDRKRGAPGQRSGQPACTNHCGARSGSTTRRTAAPSPA
jgi:hypothetical protein